MSEIGRRHVTLAADADVDGFRAAARRLVAEGVEPARVDWRIATGASDELFAEAAEPADALPGATSTLHVPSFFPPLCECAALHADPGRFALLYRLLWRLVHEPALRGDALDPDRLEAEKMARMVRRDMHKMTAFVRFRQVASTESGSDGDSGASAGDSPEARPWHVAWFEPLHHIVEATAPFFARRFAQMRWAILTPERSVRWAGATLEFGPGANRDEAPPPDAGEALWLTYYEHIFNPARLKLKMMQQEMPKRYWRNLPEAALIAPLTAAASRRSVEMVERGGTAAGKSRPAASMSLRVEPSEGTTPDAPAPPAGTLAALRKATQHCRECPIGALATQAVPGEGPDHAPLMLVGEQPGDKEDLKGRPFVGPAGQLLDKVLRDLGWPRDALFLTNAVKHFKYELRGARRIHKTPAQREAAACLHWLENEIELVRPQAIVALGATAARSLLGRAVAVTSERGRWLTRGDGLPVLVTLHPSALLRMDDAQRSAAYDAWRDDLAKAAVHLPPHRPDPDAAAPSHDPPD